MFSGIIESIGSVDSVTRSGNGQRLRIKSSLQVSELSGVGSSDRENVGLGDSIAVDGACLTVDKLYPPNGFEVTCGLESLQMTTLGNLKRGDKVHLERALRLSDRLDGHLVQGHVDGVGTTIDCTHNRESVVIWIRVPNDLMRFIAIKGSITLSGVSLTVNEIEGGTFRVNVVPYTAEETQLGKLRAGSSVNVEVDVLARYMERLLNPSPSLSYSRLDDLGYSSASNRGEKQ